MHLFIHGRPLAASEQRNDHVLLAAPEAGPMYGVLIRAVSLQLALLEGRKGARAISSIALYSLGLHQGASQSNTRSDYPWPPDSDLSRLPRYQSLFWYEASQKMICAAHLGHLEGAARKHGRGLGWVGRAQI